MSLVDTKFSFTMEEPVLGWVVLEAIKRITMPESYSGTALIEQCEKGLKVILTSPSKVVLTITGPADSYIDTKDPEFRTLEFHVVFPGGADELDAFAARRTSEIFFVEIVAELRHVSTDDIPDLEWAVCPNIEVHGHIITRVTKDEQTGDWICPTCGKLKPVAGRNYVAGSFYPHPFDWPLRY